MNGQILKLAEQAGGFKCSSDEWGFYDEGLYKFAELLLEEFREVLTEEYKKTPLECCGHFLRADEAIAEHFYGVKNES